MRLDVHWQGLEASAPARSHLQRRLGFALGRFVRRLTRVRARLSDGNGPRGGEDKVCRLQAHGSWGPVQVEERDRDLYVAIDLAAERLRRALARCLEREHFQDTGRWRALGLARRRHHHVGR